MATFIIHKRLTCLLLAAASPAWAADGATTYAVSASPAARQGLSPEQLVAVRAVGRNVLAAKRSAAGDDTADQAQLSQLRATVDKLIEAELDPQRRAEITLQQSQQPEAKARQEASRKRDTVKADARALASQLRGRGQFMKSRAETAQEVDARSGGLPVGRQRAALYGEWAGKLDAVSNDEKSPRNKLAVLTEWREKLRTQRGAKGIEGRIDPAEPHNVTPTLQAMPAGYSAGTAQVKDGQQ